MFWVGAPVAIFIRPFANIMSQSFKAASAGPRIDKTPIQYPPDRVDTVHALRHHPIPTHLVEHDLQGTDRQRDRDVNKVIADGLNTSAKLIAKLIKWGTHHSTPETERHDAIARRRR
jgi:hypothetical protein